MMGQTPQKHKGLAPMQRKAIAGIRVKYNEKRGIETDAETIKIANMSLNTKHDTSSVKAECCTETLGKTKRETKKISWKKFFIKVFSKQV